MHIPSQGWKIYVSYRAFNTKKYYDWLEVNENTRIKRYKYLIHVCFQPIYMELKHSGKLMKLQM